MFGATAIRCPGSWGEKMNFPLRIYVIGAKENKTLNSENSSAVSAVIEADMRYEAEDGIV